MSAKPDALGELHALLAEVMQEELRWYRNQDPPVPVSASVLAAVAKFLKDNSITCDPVDDAAIQELREEFQRQSRERRGGAIAAIELAKDDLEALYPLN